MAPPGEGQAPAGDFFRGLRIESIIEIRVLEVF